MNTIDNLMLAAPKGGKPKSVVHVLLRPASERQFRLGWAVTTHCYSSSGSSWDRGIFLVGPVLHRRSATADKLVSCSRAGHDGYYHGMGRSQTSFGRRIESTGNSRRRDYDLPIETPAVHCGLGPERRSFARVLSILASSVVPVSEIHVTHSHVRNSAEGLS